MRTKEHRKTCSNVSEKTGCFGERRRTSESHECKEPDTADTLVGARESFFFLWDSVRPVRLTSGLLVVLPKQDFRATAGYQKTGQCRFRADQRQFVASQYPFSADIVPVQCPN